MKINKDNSDIKKILTIILRATKLARILSKINKN